MAAGPWIATHSASISTSSNSQALTVFRHTLIDAPAHSESEVTTIQDAIEKIDKFILNEHPLQECSESDRDEERQLSFAQLRRKAIKHIMFSAITTLLTLETAGNSNDQGLRQLTQRLSE